MAAPGVKRLLQNFLPYIIIVMGALMGGLLVAWRGLDRSVARPPRPRLYQPLAFHDRDSSSSSRSGSSLVDPAAAPSKTLVIYVYHERCGSCECVWV